MDCKLVQQSYNSLNIVGGDEMLAMLYRVQFRHIGNTSQAHTSGSSSTIFRNIK